ncbi:MAG: hypothetical protein C0418_04560 [Coriobacteriaceae bacterium]|nr:hypothetical protein [Coriobacteriaceae bacterium]
MRLMNDMRDRLTPWLLVAVMAVVITPLLFSAACETACALGAMPLGACGHAHMGSSDHPMGALVTALPLTQPALGSIVLLFALFALLAASGAELAALRVLEPHDERAGTRLRV